MLRNCIATSPNRKITNQKRPRHSPVQNTRSVEMTPVPVGRARNSSSVADADPCGNRACLRWSTSSICAKCLSSMKKIDQCTIMTETAEEHCENIHFLLPSQRGNLRILNVVFINAILSVMESDWMGALCRGASAIGDLCARSGVLIGCSPRCEGGI